ncbi:zf-HC2 domain-containing protein [Streptomyces sp. NPDC058548]|uniref:zf-HC2 domain-containing protein n=1 Tax=unclassified Streptomyces TaxID=2593676 RepID=UPI00365DE5EB
MGAYVLGALSSEEDSLVARHLTECDMCGISYLEIAETPSLLALLTEEDLLAVPETDGPCGPDD